MNAPTALVLSGGGTRGAYEAGVVQGIVEVLELGPDDPAPFQVFTGSSVGAINASYLAASAHRGDLDVAGLANLWRSLRITEHARLSRRPFADRALLSAAGIENLVRCSVDWDRLHANVAEHRIRALVVAALDIATGRTAMFAHCAPGVVFTPSRDFRRVGIESPITADHVLASAAIPGLFPPRRIGQRLFYDGGLRFNTPLAPAIRVGARRLVVVSPGFSSTEPPFSSADEPAPGVPAKPPGVLFLAGKMLDGLLLDPLAYDLQVLCRFNTLLAEMLPDDEATAQRFDEVTTRLRGLPYRHLDLLTISPSLDPGELAWTYARAHRRRLLRSGWSGRIIAAMTTGRAHATDLVSYLLFDGAFAEVLLALGRADAVARADDIRSFFGSRA